MSTEQNYAPRDSYATPTSQTVNSDLQTAQNPAQHSTPDAFDRYQPVLTPGYLSRFESIHPDEYPRTCLIVAPDDRMAPLINQGYVLLAVLIEPDQYNTLSGVVAVTTSGKPGEVLLGRVQRLADDEVWIAQERPDWELGYRIERSLITSISSARYIIDGELV